MKRDTRMIKRVTAVLILAAGAYVGNALAASDDTALREALQNRYPSTEFSRVSTTPLEGIYEVTMGRQVAYTNKDGTYFIFGHLVDMVSRKDLTAEVLSRMNKVDVGSLPLQDAVKVVQGNGARRLYVFADPSCGYCKRLENELGGMDNVTIFTWPIALLSPDSKRKAVSVWCASDPGKAWVDLMRNGKEPAVAECQNPIDRNMALASKLGVSGTPTLVSVDGRVRPGYMSRPELDAWMAAAEPGAVQKSPRQ
jgi:thiol:disulfide interchange protein DsbC